MARLIGLRFVPDDMTTHWEALSDVPDDVLQAAVTLAQRTRTEFPTPFELRQDADRSGHHHDDGEGGRADQTRDLDEPYAIAIPMSGTTVQITREYRYDCEACSDSGWHTWWCGDDAPQKPPFVDDQACSRYEPHGAHTWAGPCACVSHNPSLLRKRVNQQKFYAAKETRR